MAKHPNGFRRYKLAEKQVLNLYLLFCRGLQKQYEFCLWFVAFLVKNYRFVLIQVLILDDMDLLGQGIFL